MSERILVYADECFGLNEIAAGYIDAKQPMRNLDGVFFIV